MLFWRVTDKNDVEHILNLEHVADIQMNSDERAVVWMSNGSYLTLAKNPKRRYLTEGLILDASKVDRHAIEELRKPGKERKDREHFARALARELGGAVGRNSYRVEVDFSSYERRLKRGWRGLKRSFKRKVKRGIKGVFRR